MAGMSETIARLSVSLAMDTREFATGSTKAQREIGRLQESFRALGEKWMQTGRRLTVGVTAPLTAFGVLSARAASDAQELDSAFSETFGSLTDEMRNWSVATGDAMGRSTQSIQEMANTFGIFFNQAAPTRREAAEMSKTFAVLAQDLSSFYNVDGDVALQKLRSGLSGESEPLRDFGVFLTAATVEAKGLEMGLGGLTGELTEQEKIMARYQLILESTVNAQGDVARTSDGAANQWRSFTEALQELQVVIGEKLLPLLTPIVTALTKAVNGFNNLPSGVQTAIVAIGAFMAAIGPMMLVMGTLAATLLPLFAAKFGPVGLAISAFINPLGTAISFLVQFAAQLAGMTILKTIGATLLRLAGPIGLVATAGILIYQNWDRIAGVFERFWDQAKQALGPPLQELLATIKGAFEELWNGPMGDGIRTAMDWIKQFGAAASSVFGDIVVGALGLLLDAVIVVFQNIGDVIRGINALLNGDFRGAWDASVRIVQRIFGPLADFVIGVVRRMVTGIKDWVVGRLNAIWDTVTGGIDRVKGAFFGMYDAVVGNSYVPDMVDGIAAHMARLDAVMVAPARQATSAVNEAMRDMARETQALLDRLFPEVRRLLDYRRELALIDGSDLSAEQQREARARLGIEVGGFANDNGLSIEGFNPDLVVAGAEEIARATERMGDRAETQAVRIAKSFKDMADDTLGALRRMTDSIKGGGFLSILEGVIGLGLQLGSIGVFGSKIADNINAPRGYATGTNSAARGWAWVGERGPELVRFRGGERVMNNRESMNAGRAAVDVRVGIDPRNGNVTAYVDGRVASAAPAMMQGGATIANQQAKFHNSRRLA